MSIVALSGSPSDPSRSGRLLRHVLGRFADGPAQAEIVLRELPPAALLRADVDEPAIRGACDRLAAARLVIMATPIYKASFSGLLKVFLDLLPPDALRGKTVLALGTGGSASHLLALDYALKPVLAALGARHILDTIYAVDAQLAGAGADAFVVPRELAERIDRALADAPYALRRPGPPPRALAVAA